MALGPGGPDATLVTGKQFELDLADRLRRLHEQFELRRWRFSPTVLIDTGRPNDTSGPAPVYGTYFVFAPDGDLVTNYVQVQAGWWSNRVDGDRLASVLGVMVDQAGFPDGFPRDRAVQIVYAVTLSLHAATALLAAGDVTTAIERHPRNRPLLELLRPGLAGIIGQLQQAGIAVEAPSS